MALLLPLDAALGVPSQIGKKRRGIKKTVKMPGEPFIPDQKLAFDDQTIQIQTIKERRHGSPTGAPRVAVAAIPPG